MTSQSSKNRQTTLPNTRRWNKLQAAVLGAAVLLNLASGVSADEPAVNRSVNGPSRPAVERWKRLKSQYDFAPATQSPRIEQPTRSSDEAAGTVTIRAIPEDQSAFKAVQTTTDAVAVEKPVAPAAPLKTAAAPVATADLIPQDAPDEEKPQLPSPTIKKPATPEIDPPYEEKPADVVPPDRGIRRPLTQKVPDGPPLNATQVRRIGDIAPLIDFDRDTEIKKFAAEKAREFNVRFGGEPYTPRNFPEVVVPWTAPMTQYYPLYFQDAPLERYGHTYHPLVQPVVSSARFTAQLVLMPYQMTIDPPWELSSPLGWYRPGDVVPKLHYPFPWNAKAAAVEAASIAGLIFLIQ